ncbi:oligosaccharide flippase family protein [Adlercreutzia shanghongiae]|uniref:Oligosaccharide flippase family protein n=1 Tax=Adlercreutzia shanghongiae TaxID=3111773 RepID=A0ABU6J0V1_9ACTN|nr:oligosaccharide flippase family protein [Adlercreutzia sp. R22]MEC4295535.1 oligosaccharide flippase family protein [Adlercreutzia sp. R22]
MPSDSGKAFGGAVVSAAKWSLVTQIVSKLVSPITTVVLAHILAPEVFGIVATVTMVTSFAEMFSDAGFQKYLIQHEYENYAEYQLSVNVAFWTNLAIALCLWILVIIFNGQIAVLVGNEGLGMVLVVACASLPVVSLSSVQIAVYQRAFDYRRMFPARVGSAVVVMVVSVALAFLGLGYWAMISGTICGNVFLAIQLARLSSWRPSIGYSWSMLRSMFSFSAWTLLEAFTIWLTSWAGTFVLGTVLSSTYLGMYKTSVSIVGAITGLATSAVNPIIFASLSRLQNSRPRFDAVFYSMQQYLALVLVPLAASLFVFRDLIVFVALGQDWLETSLFFGLYAAASAVVVVFCHTAAEAYRALGRPRVSTLVQVLYLVILIPSLYFAASRGYGFFSVFIPFVRAMASTVINLACCRLLIGLSPVRMFRAQLPLYGITLVVSLICVVLVEWSNSYIAQAIIFIFAVISYVVLILLFKKTRSVFIELLIRLGVSEKMINRLRLK